ALGRVLGALCWLALVAAAALAGWGAHHVLQEVQQLQRGHQDLAGQRDELSRGLHSMEQKVQSLQATFGTLESMLRSSQHKQDLTDKAVRQGESEISRIGEVLQKLQNEILKDLSDGIHVVKDARERDFTSLEHTVEERLTELTRSINDNIAVFTDMQKRGQEELNEVKAKVAVLEEAGEDRQALKALKAMVQEVQGSAKSQNEELVTLRRSLQALEAEVYSEVRELVSLKQEQQAFKEAVEAERLALQALTEKLQRSEEATTHLPDEVRRLQEELSQLRAETLRLGGDSDSGHSDSLNALLQSGQALDSRLQGVESGVQALREASAHQAESLQSLVSSSQDHEERLATLHGRLQSLGPEVDRDGLASTVQSLGEAQLALYGDVEELKRSMGELPGTVESLQRVREQVHSLLREDPAAQPPASDLLDRLSSLDNLKSSVSQVESDLKMLRTAVDSLVTYSVKIESNERDLKGAYANLDGLRKDLDRLFVEVERIYEKF
ncbi:cytoskeleton-associated protein 4, partial [Octodon degus]|uniref:Cytoskeleton-associated protein 4 n=1 Tax=Octodon degus TaxID=10160 RepID=A0A6P3EJA6_OCTDE